MSLFESGGATIFGIQVYAICILVGIIIAVIAGIKEGKKLGLWTDFVVYGVLLCVPLAIIGARLWYVLFNLDSFSSFPEVLGFKGGTFVGLSGLAIQGGIIFALIGIIVYTYVTKVSLYKVLDITAPGFFIGQICGRWGNFFNNELYGPEVKNTGLFQTILPEFITENMYIDHAYRHPTFLYEGILNFIGLVIMLILRRKSKKLRSGDLMGIYLVWYGLVRIFTETLRMQGDPNDPLMLGPIPVSILVSVIFIVVGILYLVLKRVLSKIPSGKYYYEILDEVNANKTNTLIFDLDGTLLDTRKLIDNSFIHTFKKFFPDKKLTDEDLDSFFGPPLKTTFERFEKDPSRVLEMIKYYQEFNKAYHTEYVRPFDGVKETLKNLHNKGYIIACVSSKYSDMVKFGFEDTKLLPYIDLIVAGDNVSEPKPSPEGILKAINSFRYVKNPIYIGDNVSDIKAGKAANIKTCAVMYSKFFDEVSKEEPNYYLEKFDDLPKLLGE